MHTHAGFLIFARARGWRLISRETCVLCVGAIRVLSFLISRERARRPFDLIRGKRARRYRYTREISREQEEGVGAEYRSPCVPRGYGEGIHERRRVVECSCEVSQEEVVVIYIFFFLFRG